MTKRGTPAIDGGKMSYGMPKSYDSWRLASPPDDDHHPRCACHEDQPEQCVCGCDAEGHPKDHCESGLSATCGCEGLEINDAPDCTCADLDSDDKADAVEARIERDREDF